MPRMREAIKHDDQMMHVYNRGVDRGTLFFKPDDFDLFRELLVRDLNNENIRIHAYSLMPNHFHLLLWQRLAYQVSEYIQRVCGTYAQIMNKKRSRSGHFFQDRFRANPVDSPASILRLSWYIHQNPVTANLVPTAELWKYGSMREYAGLIPPGITSMKRITDLVGGVENYMKFMRNYDPLAPESAWKYLI